MTLLPLVPWPCPRRLLSKIPKMFEAVTDSAIGISARRSPSEPHRRYQVDFETANSPPPPLRARRRSLNSPWRFQPVEPESVNYFDKGSSALQLDFAVRRPSLDALSGTPNPSHCYCSLRFNYDALRARWIRP